jgi:hypothetical protein
LAYVGSNPVVEVKLLSVPKKVLSACFLKSSFSGLPNPVLLCAASKSAHN